MILKVNWAVFLDDKLLLKLGVCLKMVGTIIEEGFVFEDLILTFFRMMSSFDALDELKSAVILQCFHHDNIVEL